VRARLTEACSSRTQPCVTVLVETCLCCRTGIFAPAPKVPECAGCGHLFASEISPEHARSGSGAGVSVVGIAVVSRRVDRAAGS